MLKVTREGVELFTAASFVSESWVNNENTKMWCLNNDWQVLIDGKKMWLNQVVQCNWSGTKRVNFCPSQKEHYKSLGLFSNMNVFCLSGEQFFFTSLDMLCHKYLHNDYSVTLHDWTLGATKTFDKYAWSKCVWDVWMIPSIRKLADLCQQNCDCDATTIALSGKWVSSRERNVKRSQVIDVWLWVKWVMSVMSVMSVMCAAVYI